MDVFTLFPNDYKFLVCLASPLVGLFPYLNYSDERVLCSAPQTFSEKKNLRKIFIIGALRTWVDSLVLLLIIEIKINFSLGFDNTEYQKNKQ